VKFDHVFADLGGVAPDRLTDGQGLAGLLLAAANAAGLNATTPPAVTTGPKGVGVALLCHGGHITLHAVPSEGLCFADVAGLGGGGADPQRGLDVIVKRLGAREVRTDARRRGPPPPLVTRTLDPERT
jgi:S-adenosylmethionine/arginine decarboxylase-like enzyme